MNYHSEPLKTAALITIGGRAYPPYGQVLMLAGGAGSGKGFQLQNVIGLRGKVLDVDNFKKLALSNAAVQRLIKRKTGIDIAGLGLDMKKPEDVSKLHQIVKDAKLEELWWKCVEMSAPLKTKPNLIFDKTLKSFEDIVNIRDAVTSVGYEMKNIHIVWVLNKIEIAVQQNQSRDRKVDENILRSTHEGVSRTMFQLVKLGDQISNYVDGDVWISFNQANVDVISQKSKAGEFIIDEKTAVCVKKQGANADLSVFNKYLIAKILEYTKDIGWQRF